MRGVEYKLSILAAVGILAFPQSSYCQEGVIKGRVVDSITSLPIEFANVHFIGTTQSTYTQADGTFQLEYDKRADSVGVSYIGYRKMSKKIAGTDSLLFRLKYDSEELKEVTIIVSHGDRAESLIRKVIEHKAVNDPSRFDNYSFNSYNKAELDLNNFKPSHKEGIAFKMQSVFNKLDTGNNENQLPVYFVETYAKNYHSKNPNVDQEQIVAKKSLGLQTDVLIRKLEKFQFNINIYDNWIQIFNKTFAGPLAQQGFAYYKYYFNDSIKVNGHIQYQIEFEPRNNYENAFKGTMWINDSTYSVSKYQMSITQNANLNFIKNIRFTEDFGLYPDGKNGMIYMPEKYTSDVKFEAGWNLIGIPAPTHSDDLVMNYVNTKFFDSISVNRTEKHETIVEIRNQDLKKQYGNSNNFWAAHRIDSLTIHEASIYKMMDTMKQFKRFDIETKIAAFAGTGFWDVKDKFRFGPYSSFLSLDKVEGLRMRSGFWTLPDLFEKWTLYGYLAYGTKDGKFKGGLGIKYVHSKTRWNKTYIYSRSDYDVIIDYDDELDRDNLISSILRKNVPSFRSYIQELQLGHEHQITKNIVSHTSLTYRIYNPVFDFSYHPEDPKTDLPIDTAFRHILPIAEFNTNLRIAKDQKTVVVNYDLLNLINYNPVLSIGYTYGFETRKTEFSYQKIIVALEQNLKVPPKMLCYYRISAGITFGTVPYILLNVPRGNEFYVSSKYSFNTMIPYEFASDKFISLQTRFLGGGIMLDKIPLLQKLGWRERISFNTFMGGLSSENQKFNASNKINVANKTPFMEAGIGIENIFHAISVEYIKRFTYLQNPYAKKGGLYLGVQLSF
ncbi:MAG: carboxypeptidase-like regulatory domain-containing protein [Bacteroidetes bacterium]|nr:carboxypeptidase-like regulatory domain-containing protein [Bacteroidota bacterium]